MGDKGKNDELNIELNIVFRYLVKKDKWYPRGINKVSRFRNN